VIDEPFDAFVQRQTEYKKWKVVGLALARPLEASARVSKIRRRPQAAGAARRAPAPTWHVATATFEAGLRVSRHRIGLRAIRGRGRVGAFGRDVFAKMVANILEHIPDRIRDFPQRLHECA